MAGAKLTINADIGSAQAVLRQLLGRLEGDGRNLLLQQIGEYMLDATRERAAREVDPDGIAWRALGPDYARYKRKVRPGVPILKFDYHMLGDQLSWQIEGDSVLVGTNAVYGAIHQFGGQPGMAPGAAAIPPRPWLGISSDDEDEILGILGDHLELASGGDSPTA